MKKILPIISIVFICFSCGSDNLTKDNASEIVSQQFPWKISSDITLFASSKARELEPKGFIKYYRYKKKPSDTYFTHDISLTDKFIPFITNNQWKANQRYKRIDVDYKVKAYGGLLESIEIINVFQDENSAEIEHRVRFNENELHKYIGRYGWFRYKDGQTFTIKQKAIRNSEGEWKLQSLKTYPNPS